MSSQPESVQTPIGAEALANLTLAIRGEIISPEDAGYQQSRSIWNGMIDRRPALIVRALGVSDVVACVRFARENGLPISIKGGGHNIAGLAVADGAVMLDMSLMRGVWVDPQASTAHAQAGCLLGDVDRETQLHGLATVLGFVSNTGIAGLTLGGGFGYLTRRFGWTSDNVLSMGVVTADGRVVRASDTINSDLFWGLRGGGGNFGVITDFEYKLYPVGPEIIGGAVAWRVEEAPAVLELFRDLLENGSLELSCAAVIRLAPPAPWLPAEIHGKLIILLVVCHTGPLANAEAEVAQIKSFGTPVGDVLQRRSYVSQQSLLDATQPAGRRYYWKSEFLAGVDKDFFARFLEHSSRLRSPHSGLVLFPLGGALRNLPATHSPAGNRDAGLVLNITGSWDGAGEDDSNIEWVRAAWQSMKEFSTGGTYINFQTEEEGDDRLRAAYGDHMERLVEIKTKWDPENLFHLNRNIRPLAGA